MAYTVLVNGRPIRGNQVLEIKAGAVIVDGREVAKTEGMLALAPGGTLKLITDSSVSIITQGCTLTDIEVK
jgi:hypothetical protein